MSLIKSEALRDIPQNQCRSPWEHLQAITQATRADLVHRYANVRTEYQLTQDGIIAHYYGDALPDQVDDRGDC